jgi:hypothetical protein
MDERERPKIASNDWRWTLRASNVPIDIGSKSLKNWDTESARLSVKTKHLDRLKRLLIETAVLFGIVFAVALFVAPWLTETIKNALP